MTTATSTQLVSATGTKTLSWTYQAFSNDSVEVVIKEMTDFMDKKLTPAQASTAKADISDAKGRDAKGIIYFVTNPDSDIPSNRPFMANWTKESFRNDKQGELYQPGLDKINDLTDEQALSCQVGLADARDRDATLVVFWGQYPVQS